MRWSFCFTLGKTIRSRCGPSSIGSHESSRALDVRLKHYARVGLLIIDELGYLSYDARNTDLLFQLVCPRYEKKSLVLTTHQPFSAWPSIFPNASCATAA